VVYKVLPADNGGEAGQFEERDEREPQLTGHVRFRALQSKQHDLERQKITDNLKKGLEHRPERDELVERMFPSSCPSLAAAPRPTNGALLKLCFAVPKYCVLHAD
jgi:hypothetical protein